MEKSGVMNMTQGKIMPILFSFTLPIMLSGFLQQLYGAMDSAVVGQFDGPDALGAIGATASLTNLILSLFIGIATGAGIVVAQFIGANDKKEVSRAVHTSYAFGIAGGIFLMIFGCLFSGSILMLMSVPEDIYPLANKYMTIYFLGAVPSLIYNFGSGILRAAGDSKRPLYYLAAAAAINIIFNLIFVIVFHMGVTGVAISTIMSQTVSAFLVTRRLMKTDEYIKLRLKAIKFHKKMLLRIVKIGIPAGIQGAVFSFSNTVIQSTINTFGKAAVAGCSASSQVENFVYMVMNSISVASTTFIGQNFGAGKFDRCHEGMKKSFAFVTVVGIFLGALMGVFRIPLLKIFTDNQNALLYGEERIIVFAATYFLCGIMDVLSGTIRGFGNSFSPMLICLIGVTGSRMLWIFSVLPFKREIATVYAAFPVSWIITIAALWIYYIFYRKKVKGKYEAMFAENIKI